MNQPVTTIKLIIATIIAVLLACIIYFVIVLPAEYNQDPTGLGEKLGLMALSTPNDPKTITLNNDTTTKMVTFNQGEVTISVPANTGIEYKFTIQKFGRLVYEWQTMDESTIYFDFHGEPEGDKTGFFESYSISTATQVKGTVTVPFTGSHGWYWKNTTDHDVSIKLTTSGNYTVIGLK